MSDRCSEVEKQLDDFKDAYVKNNKEFLQLSFIVGELRDTLKEHIRNTEEYKKEREDKEIEYHSNIDEKLEKIEEKMLPFVKVKIASEVSYKFVLGVAGLIVLTVGAFVAVKKLFE